MSIQTYVITSSFIIRLLLYVDVITNCLKVSCYYNDHIQCITHPLRQGYLEPLLSLSGIILNLNSFTCCIHIFYSLDVSSQPSVLIPGGLVYYPHSWPHGHKPALFHCIKITVVCNPLPLLPTQIEFIIHILKFIITLCPLLEVSKLLRF